MRSDPAEVYAECPRRHFDDYQPNRGLLTGDEFLSTGFSKRQHSQNPISGCGGGQMLERVTADNMVESENLPVGSLKKLGEDVKAKDDREVPAARVPRRQQERKQQRKRRIELDRSVDAQVAVAMNLVPIPLHDTTRAQNNEPWKKLQSGANAHALDDQRRHQRSENDRHRQAVPDQMRIVRSQVVVSRSERGQQETDEHSEKGPALARIEQCFLGMTSNEQNSADAHDSERGIRDYIAKVRDSQPPTLVGELMIRSRLRDRREAKDQHADTKRHSEHECDAVLAREQVGLRLKHQI